MGSRAWTAIAKANSPFPSLSSPGTCRFCRRAWSTSTSIARDSPASNGCRRLSPVVDLPPLRGREWIETLQMQQLQPWRAGANRGAGTCRLRRLCRVQLGDPGGTPGGRTGPRPCRARTGASALGMAPRPSSRTWAGASTGGIFGEHPVVVSGSAVFADAPLLHIEEISGDFGNDLAQLQHFEPALRDLGRTARSRLCRPARIVPGSRYAS